MAEVGNRTEREREDGVEKTYGGSGGRETGRPGAEARMLVVNADEFGRTPQVTRGIVRAFENGVVTSASAMVRRPGADEAARYARSHPALSVGLHLELGEWRHLDGEWVEVEAVVPPDDEDAVAAEVHRQLARFRELFGTDPTHLDSHQNAHQSEPLRSILLGLAREIGVPLRHFTPGIFVCTEFFGQTSTGAPFPDGISVDRMLRIIAALPAGCTELVCHPGAGARGDADPYGEERALELAVLCDPRVRAALDLGGVRLGSFREAPADLASEAAPCEPSFRKRGQAAFRRGEHELAGFWFRRAVAVDPTRPWSWLWLARAQAEMGRPEASKTSIQEALRLRPGWPAAGIHLADLLLDEGDEAGAAGILGYLAKEDHDGRDAAWVASAVARRVARLRDPATALGVAKALNEAHPELEEGLAARAAALWRTGDRGGAFRLLAPPPGRNGTSRLRATAEFHLEIDDPREAWRVFRGRPVDRDDHALLVRIAHGLRRIGELTLAWEVLERAIAVRPADRRTRHWRDVVRGEVQVLSGSWRPEVVPERHHRPLPGRVLHLVGRSLPHVQSGYSVRTHYVARCQAEADYEPHVATQLGFPWDDGVPEAQVAEELDGIPYHRLSAPEGAPADLAHRLSLNLRELFGLARRIRPGVIHAASDYRNALLALELGRALGVPVVYEVRGFWEETWRSKRNGDSASAQAYRWRRERELACMAGADRVVTLAAVMKDELVRRGIPGERIGVVPNAVDAEAFAPAPRDPKLAGLLGIAPDEVVLGYISSFSPYEGIVHLIDATAILARKGLPVKCLLVGDGEDRTRLEARARDAGIADRVRFTGRVPHEDVGRYYGMIDVFVVPRTSDRVCQLVTPLKPCEAMATGRALVVSALPALEEMVAAGRTGLTFRPEDPGHLAAVVEPLVRSPRVRESFGRRAREWVCRNRTWSQNGERYAALYASLGVRGLSGRVDPGALSRSRDSIPRPVQPAPLGPHQRRRALP